MASTGDPTRECRCTPALNPTLSVTRNGLIDWLRPLDEDVGTDEGGLALQSSDGDLYEIGGLPLDGIDPRACRNGKKGLQDRGLQTLAIPPSSIVYPMPPHERTRNCYPVTAMLWTLFVILLVLWLLGLVTSYTMGGFIHILLVVAIAVALVQIISGRRAI